MRLFFSPFSQLIPDPPTKSKSQPFSSDEKLLWVRMKTHRFSISNAQIFEDELQETKDRYQLGGEGGLKTLC